MQGQKATSEGTLLIEQKVRAYVHLAQRNEDLWSAFLVFLGALSLLSAIPFYPLPVAVVLALACGAVAYKSPPIGVALGFVLILPALSYQSAIFGWVGLMLLALIFFEVFEHWGEIALLQILVLLPFAVFPFSLLGGLIYFGMIWGSFHFGSAKSVLISAASVFTVLLLTSIWLTPNSAFFQINLSQYPALSYLQLSKPALPLAGVSGGIVPALSNMMDMRAPGQAWTALGQIGSNMVKILLFDSGIAQMAVWAVVLFFAGWFPGKSRSRWKQTIAALPVLLVPAAYFFISQFYSYPFFPTMFLYAGISVAAVALLDFAKVTFSRERKIVRRKKSQKFGKFGFGDAGESGETLESVGGYESVKKELRDSIMLPLQSKDLAYAYKLKVPSGILLFGPPGTGKTMLMRALANDMDYSFYPVKTPEILSMWFGESEKNIVEIFTRARDTAPAILFFDEIDAIGKRRDLAGMDNVTPRVLSSLLQEMDGAKKSRKQVIVVGATNVPNQLDPALLRPGRFDKIIYMHLPDSEARKAIFRVLLKNLPLSRDIDYAELAKKSRRFSGADIASVIKTALRKAAEDAKKEGKVIPIRMGHLLEILEKTKPSTSLAALEDYEQFQLDFERSEAGVSEAEEEKKKEKAVSWEDVAGLDDVKKVFREAIDVPLLHPELLEEFRVKPSKGILLFGPPGCGKTLVVRAASNELDVSFLTISGAQLVQKGYTHAVNVIKETFNRARENPPSVIFVDEIESFAPARGMGRSDIIGQFLVEMDGVRENEGVLVVGATNRPDMLDKAILRPGRFDKVIYVHPPDEGGRKELFKIHLGKFAKGLKLKPLAQITDGFTGADIAALSQQAKMGLLRRKISGKKPKLTNKAIEELLSGMKPSVTPRMLEDYEQFVRIYGERK